MSRTTRMKNIDITKVCRICMTQKGHLRDIHNTKIPKMMETIALIEVSEDDQLPRSICVICFRLVAKLYVFKKKIERSDRLLRQHIKLNVKQSDIINVALSEADISEPVSVDENTYLSEEDIPLSNRIKKDALQELDINEFHQQEKTIQIFSEGPPPLVPLSDFVERSVAKLPADAPPLIPIKPLVSIKILENIIPAEDISYKCSNCNESFVSVAALKEHKLSTCQQNVLQCNICKKEFKERKRLIGHLKGHMVVKDYGCKICGKQYPNPSTFRIHMRTHTGERPYKCQICNKGFIRWAGVVGHMKTHDELKPYKCETCGRCFKISSNLARHKKLHSDNLPFCCSHCGKCFGQSENLQMHIRTYHTNERPFLCNHCGKGFVNATRLYRHIWIHTGFKPYPCKFCSKSYSNSKDLKNHERQQHLEQNKEEPKSYTCSICDRKFSHPCRLARHKRVHDNYFECTYCKKVFSSEWGRNKHQKCMHNMKNVLKTKQEVIVAFQPDYYVECLVKNEENEKPSVN